MAIGKKTNNHGVLGISREDLIALLDEAREAASEYAGSLNNGFGGWYADYLIKHQERLTGNRITEMPCQVGDRLWCLVGSDCSVVMEMIVDNIFINKLVTVVGLSGPGKYQEILAEDIGKIAFWSEDEAVAAKEDCLRVVDKLLQEASKKCKESNTDHIGAFLDVLDDRSSGLLEPD